MKLRVLLADDHLLFRTALRMSLETLPDIDIVAEVDTGFAAVACVSQRGVDVVCMDINMPGLNGIEATRLIVAAHPQVRVIGLSAHADPVRVADMFRAGALGYVLKGSAGQELPQAIARVRDSLAYISPELGFIDVAELMRFAGPADRPTP